MTCTLILGGARSGKSRRALALAEQSHDQRIFIATAEALDEEMAARIEQHKAERGRGWITLEEPIDLCAAIERSAALDKVCVVDCLTLWISNLMHHQRNLNDETDRLCAMLAKSSGAIVMVSNEVGMGLVPESALGRRFRDAQGRLNQAVANVCDRVEFVAAGLPITLKG